MFNYGKLIFKNKNFYDFQKKFNFDQFKERPKRHFLLKFNLKQNLNLDQTGNLKFYTDSLIDEQQEIIENYEKNGTLIFGSKLYINIKVLFQIKQELVLYFNQMTKSFPINF